MIKKDLVKKTTVIAITGALTVAMTAIVFAKPGGFENGMQGRDRMEDMRGGPNGNIGFDGDMSGMPGGGAPDGERPEITLGEVEDDDIGERGAGKDFNDGRPEMQGDIALDGERPELPDGEDFTGERPELPDSEEFTEERPELPDGEKSDRENHDMPGGRESVNRKSDVRADRKDMKGINTEDIKTAVDAIEDEDTKTALGTLIDDYENARDAMKTAIEEDAEDINTYREAEKSAMEELRTALEEAGISTGQERPDGKEAGNDADNENTSKREMRQGDSTQQKQVPSEQGN